MTTIQEHRPCDLCKLYLGTTNGPVAPRGSATPKILIVGEAPGPEEDTQGQLFVGPTGKKLQSYLEYVGLSEDLVRYESLIKCIPRMKDGRGIRPPSDEELGHCVSYLYQEIAALQPELIITLGNNPLKIFTGKSAITKARGHIYDWTLPDEVPKVVGQQREFKILPSIHPAAVLRGNLSYEEAILADLSFAKEFLFGTNRKENYKFLGSINEIEKVLKDITRGLDAGKYKYVALDTETTGLNPWEKDAKLICYSLAVTPNEGYCIPVYYSGPGMFNEDPLYIAAVRSLMIDFLKRAPVVGHNIKFDIKWSRRFLDADIPNVVFDTMLAAWALYSDTIPHGLEYLSSAHLGIHASKQEMHEALGKLPADERHMGNVSREILNSYSCRDADCTLQLANLYWADLEKQNLYDAYKELSLDMVVPFSDIEFEGAAFDPAPVEEARKEYEEKIKLVPEIMHSHGYDKLFDATKRKLQYLKAVSALYKHKKVTDPQLKEKLEKISKRFKRSRTCVKPSRDEELYMYPESLDELLAWTSKTLSSIKLPADLEVVLQKAVLKVEEESYTLSISAPGDIALLFYDAFRLPIRGITESKAPSTSKHVIIDLLGVLETWVSQVPQWGDIFEFMKFYQELKKDQKLYSSYLVKLPLYADSRSRIHTNYNIGQTATGRFSSSDPSFHTLPWKSTAKKAFISRFDHGMLTCCDFSQVEMRVMALFSGDEALLEVFRKGGDVHLANAVRLYKKPADQISVIERKKTKIASFGILYGQGAKGLSEQHHIPVEEAQDLIDTFYREFPLIKRWMDTQQEYVRQNHCSYTAFGHRRLIPESYSYNKDDLAKSERIAVNSPIQGTASQLTATALKRIYWRLKNAGMHSSVFGFVHDEISVDTHPAELFQVFSIMKKELGDMPPRLYPWVTIPLAYSFELGVTWGEKLDIEPDLVGLRSFKLDGDPISAKKIVDTASKWKDPFLVVSEEHYENSEGKSMVKMELSSDMPNNLTKPIVSPEV